MHIIDKYLTMEIKQLYADFEQNIHNKRSYYIFEKDCSSLVIQNYIFVLCEKEDVDKGSGFFVLFWQTCSHIGFPG